MQQRIESSSVEWEGTSHLNVIDVLRLRHLLHLLLLGLKRLIKLLKTLLRLVHLCGGHNGRIQKVLKRDEINEFDHPTPTTTHLWGNIPLGKQPSRWSYTFAKLGPSLTTTE